MMSVVTCHRLICCSVRPRWPRWRRRRGCHRRRAVAAAKAIAVTSFFLPLLTSAGDRDAGQRHHGVILRSDHLSVGSVHRTELLALLWWTQSQRSGASKKDRRWVPSTSGLAPLSGSCPHCRQGRGSRQQHGLSSDRVPICSGRKPPATRFLPATRDSARAHRAVSVRPPNLAAQRPAGRLNRNQPAQHPATTFRRLLLGELLGSAPKIRPPVAAKGCPAAR